MNILKIIEYRIMGYTAGVFCGDFNLTKVNVYFL